MRLKDILRFVKELDLVDSAEVMRAVQRYRDFWKPESAGFQTKVVLLAESHKHTSKEEFSIPHRSEFASGLRTKNHRFPRHFVRFVYCLGYGELSVLDSYVQGNNGSPDYWRILYSCAHRVERTNDFESVERGGAERRMAAKVKLLRGLQKNGIWLVDASPLGIDVFGGGVKRKIIRFCWERYTRGMLGNLRGLRRVVIIGSSVNNAIKRELRSFERERGNLEVGPVFRQPRASPYTLSDYHRLFDACVLAD